MSSPGGGIESSLSREGRSVLVEIERLIGTQFRVKLRDVGGSGEVNLGDVELPVKDIGRYQSLGEIAKGGVGEVYRVRDLDLGRDVALKVIREEFRGDRVVVQRFVEEAQVGGQLQHPGIVPVYELGLREDGNPYFTMKLVKGKTLSEALGERAGPDDSLRKFLAIFEELCHAIAFSHSRGVVHRDIKPANILLGSYGEVLVVDWGFAKVLSRGGVADEKQAARQQQAARERQAEAPAIRTVRSDDAGSQSVAGSVMGTPAYMPPEQARGKVDEVDRRSDVFSLGAILTEILTGKPAYVAESSRDVLMLAAQGRLEDAQKRLSECGQDAKLVKIARACLETDRKNRPRDARVVANAISAFQISVDMRAHQAQVHVAKSKALAAQAQKGRKLVVALAATVLLAVLVGVGALVTMGRREAERVSDLVARVSSSIEEASRNARVGRETGDLTAWAAALESARRAADLAGDDAVPDGERNRAKALLAQVGEEREAAARHAERRASNERLLARLERIRNDSVDDVGHPAIDGAYLDAFTQAGIPVNRMTEPEAITAIRDSGIAEALAPAIDAWVGVRRQAWPERTAYWQKLYEIVRAVDSDAWRNDLREAWKTRDSRRLNSLADSLDPDRLQPSSLVLLGNSLGEAGDTERAIEVLRAAQRAHPDDFWVNHYLSYWLLRNERWEETIRFALVALALKEDSPATTVNLGIAYGGLGDVEGEENAYRRAIEVESSFARAHYNLALVLKQNGEREEAIASLNRAIRHRPDYSLAHSALGSWRAEMGDTEDALEALRAAVRHGGGTNARLRLSRILRERGDEGDLDEARRHADDARRAEPGNAACHYELGAVFVRLGEIESALMAYGKACEIAPEYGLAQRGLVQCLDLEGNLEEKILEWKVEIEKDPSAWEARYRVALAYARRGGVEAAIEQLEEVVKQLPEETWALKELAFLQKDVSLATAAETYRRTVELDPQDALAWNDYGATLHRLGRMEQAARAYRRAIELEPEDITARFNLAFVAGEARRLGEAISAYEGVLKLDPTHAAALPEYVRLVNQRNDEGDREAGIDAALRAIRLVPDGSAYHHALGTAMGFAHDLEEARRVYHREAGEPEASNRAGFLNNFGVSRWNVGEAEEALAAQLEATELAPENATFLSNVVYAYRVIGKTDRAVSYARERLRRAPRWSGAIYALEFALAGVGDADLVVEAWREAVSLLSRNEEGEVAVEFGGDAPDWDPRRATGAPDAERITSACSHTWMPAWPEGGIAWLELAYDPPMRAHMARIHENETAGAVVRLLAAGEDGVWVTIWEGEDPLENPGVSELSFETTDFEITRIRIVLDTDRTEGWEGIDAVELIGPERRAWAVGAAASSVYGQNDIYNLKSRLINALVLRGRPEDLQETARLALENARALPAAAVLHRDLGIAYGRQGEVDAAVETWEREFPAATDLLRSWFQQGLSVGLGHVQRYGEAAAAAFESLSLNPENLFACFQVGWYLAYRKSPEEARAELDERQPGLGEEALAEFYRGLGVVNTNLRQWDEALEAWQLVVELVPGHAQHTEHLTALAQAKRNRGDLAGGIETLKEALRKSSNSAQLHTLLGDYEFQRGDLEAAVAEYRNSLALTRYSGTTNYHLGVALIEMGKVEEGLDSIRRAPLEFGSEYRRGWEAEGHRMLELRESASGILSGNARPADAGEAVDYAMFCWYSGFPAVAVGYFDQAFERDPALAADRESGTRYAAVRAAVRSGRFEKARRWLREEFEAWKVVLAESPGDSLTDVGTANFRYAHPVSWSYDWALIPVRTEEGRAELPEGEQEAWRALFAEVDGFLKQLVDRRVGR